MLKDKPNEKSIQEIWSPNPSQYSGTRSSNKLIIVAGIVTFVVIIVVMFESVVVVEAGHRGVVLYVGAVENRVLGEGIHFIIPFAEQVVPLEVWYFEIPGRRGCRF